MLKRKKQLLISTIRYLKDISVTINRSKVSVINLLTI